MILCDFAHGMAKYLLDGLVVRGRGVDVVRVPPEGLVLRASQMGLNSCSLCCSVEGSVVLMEDKMLLET